MEIFKKELGERIREKRKEAGMSQHALSIAVGKNSMSYMSLIERGERNMLVKDFYKVCTILGTTPNYLLTGRMAI